MNKRTVFGQVFVPCDVADSIISRFGSHSDREGFYEREAKKLSSSVKERIEAFLGATFGVEGVKFTFSRRAGCQCPCSPGWSISGKVTKEVGDWDSPFGEHMSRLQNLPVRMRLMFHVDEEGHIEVHGHRKEVSYVWRPNLNKKRAPVRTIDFIQTVIATIV